MLSRALQETFELPIKVRSHCLAVAADVNLLETTASTEPIVPRQMEIGLMQAATMNAFRSSDAVDVERSCTKRRLSLRSCLHGSQSVGLFARLHAESITAVL